jgi:hypothetical protein
MPVQPVVQPAPVVVQASPQPAPVVPNTENLLLRILERLQLLTGNNNAPPPAPTAAPPAAAPTPIVPTQAEIATNVIPQARALHVGHSVANSLLVPEPEVAPSVDPVTEPPAPVVETIVETIPEVPTSPEFVPATGPPMSEAPVEPELATAQEPVSEAPVEASPEPILALNAFGPFSKIQAELLAAIQTNPAAAVAAAEAVQAAARAAAMAAAKTPAEAPVEPADPAMVRRKRQSLLNELPVTPAKFYTMNFSGRFLKFETS